MVYDLYGNQTTNYAITGSGSLTKFGSGLLTLLASGNTAAIDTQLRFTGGVTVTSGTLQIMNANALFNNNSGTAAANISIPPAPCSNSTRPATLRRSGTSPIGPWAQPAG